MADMVLEQLFWWVVTWAFAMGVIYLTNLEDDDDDNSI